MFPFEEIHTTISFSLKFKRCRQGVRLNLINHFVGFIRVNLLENLAFRNPVFRWESYKGSV